MKSNEEIKDQLQNGPNIQNSFFFKNYEIDFLRVGVFGTSIINGVAVPKIDQKTYICKIDNNKLKLISTYEPGFFLVQIFLDQYRNIGKPLPTINPSTHPLRNHWYTSAEKLKKAMQIMLMPLESYTDFI